MEIGSYTRNILIEKQKDGRWAILLQSNAWSAADLGGTSYALFGYVGKDNMVQLKGCTAQAVMPE